MPRSEPRPARWLSPPRGLPAGVRALSTTRLGGIGLGPYATANFGARGGDAADVVAANRRRLGADAGLPAAPCWLRQVHGHTVVQADGLAGERCAPEADAAWTAQPGTVCAVLTADCLPVVLAAADASTVAVAHAGWRGLAAGVLENTLAAMPAPAGDIHAWLGPAIGPAAFEVGPEVRAAFVDGDPALASAFRRGRDDRWHADLRALARRRLRAAGVDSVQGSDYCTFSRSDLFFSHRREPQQSGRMATLAWLVDARPHAVTGG